MEEEKFVEDSSGSGARSLAGYDYQVDVSIWLALDLMLGSGLTQMIELEPGSEEDIEAQVADDEPERVETRVGLDDYTLVVQVKLRGGDAWTIKGINRLLNHGGTTRQSAAQKLNDPTVRYVLVTSAVLNGEAKALRVKQVGSWPQKKNKLPASISKILPIDAGGRIAVVDNLYEERLEQDIKRLLIERFGIPNSGWNKCLQKLREEAKLRVRRVGEGKWHREELAQVIRNHDGYLASSPQLDDYVYPRNWQDIRKAMGSPKYAALIIGQSGTGKTLATNKIFEELRRDIPGLTRIPIRHGPQELHDDRTPKPVLYDIEDPWGRYDFDPASRSWNDQLSKYMALARADRMIIATSRRDVASASGALKSVEPWIIHLEAEQYGKLERQKLYRMRIDALPRDVQVLAADAENIVLKELATPLEIEKFFDALRIMDRSAKRKNQNFISEAINKAHEQSIEQTVILQIEQRKDVAAAAVIWAFLKASEHLSLKVIRSLELELSESLTELPNGVMPIVDFFVAARNFRLRNGYISYYHPRVEAGIEGALKQNAIKAKIALRTFLEVLMGFDGLEESCGAEIAARVVAAAKRFPELEFSPKQQAAHQIDNWLSDRFDDPSYALSEHITLAAKAGSSNSNVGEFARYLLHKPDKSFLGFNYWEVPSKSDAWYNRLQADSKISYIAGRFIREMLPEDQRCYSNKLITDLDRLASNLTPAYLEAANKILNYGYVNSSGVIATGALRDINGFEPILDKAVKVLMPSEEQQKQNAEIHLAIINEVYNSDYAEYVCESDDGYTASEFVKAYVDHVREVKGWKHLVEHRHAEHFLSYWMRSLHNSARIGRIAQGEMTGAFIAAYNSEEESTLWFVLIEHWDHNYIDQLLYRVHIGSSWSDVRLAALACLIKHTQNFLNTIIDELSLAGNNDRLIELMLDLASLQNRSTIGGEDLNLAIPLKNVMDQLRTELQELCKAANSNIGAQQPLSEAVKKLLESIVCSSPNVRMFRILKYRELPYSVRTDIEWILANSDECKDCVKALDAAIALDFHDVIVKALNHRFSHVVAKALVTLGENAPTPIPIEYLNLVNAEGSPVRKALALLLTSKPHLDHLPVLLQLVQDQWSSSSSRYGEDDCFQIARAAVDAISKIKPLEDTILEKLLKIALDTSDWSLCKNLFNVIAEQGGYTFQKQLFELAIVPGRIEVRLSAASAILTNLEILDIEIVGQITADMLITLTPKIAVILTLIIAHHASPAKNLEIAREISANLKRRGLLLLMLWLMDDSDDCIKSLIEKLLPKDHPSLEWLRSGRIELANDALIADLGDPAICREILFWLNPKDVNE